MSLSLQQFHRALRRSLLSFFFCTAFAPGHALTVNPDFNLENFLMIGAAFARQPVFGSGLSVPLQKLLQSGLAVRVRNSFSARFKRLFEEQPLKHLPCWPESRVHINSS